MTKTQVSELYVAIFNRASEGRGNINWQNTKFSKIQTADAMLDTNAAKEYFKDSLNNDLDFVKHIYINTLNKTYEDDKAGIDGWVAYLKQKSLDGELLHTRGDLIASIVEALSSYNPKGGSKYNANETKANEAYSQFTNRVEVSNYMADTIYEVTNDYSISTSFQSTNNPNGKLIVSSLSKSIQNAKTIIDADKRSTTNDTVSALSNMATKGVLILDSNKHWEKESITYNFNEKIPDNYYTYANNELTSGWKALNQEQRSSVDSIIQKLQKLIATPIKKVSREADISFNTLDMPSNQSGFAFLPGTEDLYEGDVFLSSRFNTANSDIFKEGEYGYSTIVHELGHALGLTHPYGNPQRLDINHTVMSYINHNSYVPLLVFNNSQMEIEYKQVEASFYSLYDIAALQSIYGANTNTNTEDNTYTMSFKDPKVITLWDAGGEDTIDLSSAKGASRIDLNAGSLNSADEYSLFQIIELHQDIAKQNNFESSWIARSITKLYLENNLYTGKNNLAIATGVIIENILTGDGDDIITDNYVDNIISSGAGNDIIYAGHGGVDHIDGGLGYDTLYLNLEKESINIVKNGDSYSLMSENTQIIFVGIEEIILTNGVSYAPDFLIA